MIKEKNNEEINIDTKQRYPFCASFCFKITKENKFNYLGKLFPNILGKIFEDMNNKMIDMKKRNIRYLIIS